MELTGEDPALCVTWTGAARRKVDLAVPDPFIFNTPPNVNLMIDGAPGLSIHSRMTPKRARELGMALTLAADQAEGAAYVDETEEDTEAPAPAVQLEEKTPPAARGWPPAGEVEK